MTARSAARVHRIALAVAFAVHVLVVVSIVRQPLDANRAPRGERSLVWPLYMDTTHRRGPGADFFGVYAAGIQPENRAGIYVDIADPHVPVGVPYGYPFRYLPIVSQVLGPLARLLPPRAAYVAWCVVIEAVCLAAVAFFRRRATHESLRTFGTVALFLSTPYFLELSMGQFTFVTIALILGALAALEFRTPTAARTRGAWLAFGFASVVKLFPLVVTPAVLRVRGAWKLVAATLAFIVVSASLFFATHAGVLVAFLDINTGGKMDGLDAGNHGLLYIVHRLTRDAVHWTPPSWTKVVAAWQILLLAAIGLAVLCARRCSALHGGAILVIAFVLSYVHVWEHHYSATLLAALVVLGTFVEEDGGWSRRARIVAVAIAVLAAPTPFIFIDPHPEPSLWDPSTRWGALAFLPPLAKVVPTSVVLVLALRALASDGFALPPWAPSWLTSRLARRAATKTSA
jgi:hypothetical protein